MLIYGMTLYNSSIKDTFKTNKLESNPKIAAKIDVSENLILANVNVLFDKKSSVISKENYVL